VECPFQVVGFTSVYIFLSYFMNLIVVLNFVYVNGLFTIMDEFISYIHDHLECCRCI
jgi:hypothetical protein